MSCSTHSGPVIAFVEEMIMNDSTLPQYMKNGRWTHYRIEYGFECGCPEGRLFLPRGVDIVKVERFLRRLCGSTIKLVGKKLKRR